MFIIKVRAAFTALGSMAAGNVSRYAWQSRHLVTSTERSSLAQRGFNALVEHTESLFSSPAIVNSMPIEENATRETDHAAAHNTGIRKGHTNISDAI
jgi:hypothetical protein